jgi:hypothetical protein
MFGFNLLLRLVSVLVDSWQRLRRLEAGMHAPRFDLRADSNHDQTDISVTSWTSVMHGHDAHARLQRAMHW